MTRIVKTLDRRALFASGAAAALLAATGVSASGGPRRGGRLRIALSGASRDDTWLQGDGLFMQVARQGAVFDSLTEVAADGTLRGELATGWVSSNDARVWVFDLRPNVKFHDGAPFTAQDVVASAEGFAAGSVQAIGDLQVSFTLHDPDPILPIRFAQPEYFIRSAHAPQSGVGTGLYRVTKFDAGRHLIATRVEQHYKDGLAGWFDQVELVSLPAEKVRAQALRERLVDVADLDSVSDLAALEDVVLLPDANSMSHAVRGDMGLPARIGTDHPLDNLRAAERWWLG
jgi:ABC-type transport system substrate-binding protein